MHSEGQLRNLTLALAIGALIGAPSLGAADARLSAQQTYRIVEPGPIVLYTRSESVRLNKGSRTVWRYFFSVAPDSPLPVKTPSFEPHGRFMPLPLV